MPMKIDVPFNQFHVWMGLRFISIRSIDYIFTEKKNSLCLNVALAGFFFFCVYVSTYHYLLFSGIG